MCIFIIFKAIAACTLHYVHLIFGIGVVSLTKIDAKGRELKVKLVETLRTAVDEYQGLYVLNFENMRSSKFRDIRMDWKESK